MRSVRDVDVTPGRVGTGTMKTEDGKESAKTAVMRAKELKARVKSAIKCQKELNATLGKRKNRQWG